MTRAGLPTTSMRAGTSRRRARRAEAARAWRSSAARASAACRRRLPPAPSRLRRARCRGRRLRSGGSPRSYARAGQRRLERLERAHDGETVARFLVLAGPVGDEAEEMRALEPQRLVVRDARAEDVPGARSP